MALLVHGHVAFVGIMGIYVLFVLVTWLLLHRPSRKVPELKRIRIPLIVSGVTVFLFGLPMALELVLHWPGQFGLYLRYLRSNLHEHSHSVGQVTSYVAQFWPGGHIGAVLLVFAGLGAAGLAVTDPDRDRRLFVQGLLWGVVVLTVEVWCYAYKAVDYFMSYECYFYYAIPALIGAALAVGVGGRFGPVLWELSAPRTRRSMSAGLVALSAASGVMVFAAQASTNNTYRGDHSLPRIAAAVHRSPLRKGKGVSVSLGPPGTRTADWVDVVGFLVAASREGYRPCVANPAWKFMMTGGYICSPSEARDRWEIAVDQSNVPIPRGATVLFRTTSVEVFVGRSAASGVEK